MSLDRRFIPAYLGLCLLLGGASAAGFQANALLQVAAVGLLVVVACTRRAAPLRPEGRSLAALTALWLALVAAQLVPLPPAVWTSLPGRELVSAGYAQLGLSLPWLPLSLAPQQTLASLVWALPALALLFAVLRLGVHKVEILAWGLLSISCASILLGAIQLGGGEASPSYLYAVTNHGAMVGFFSNSNHLSTLLLMTVPFAGALVATSMGSRRRERSPKLPLLVILSLVLIGGIVLNGSLAGIGLAVPVAGATLMLVRSTIARKIPNWVGLALLLLTPVIIVGLMLAPIRGNYLVDSASVSQESRSRMLETSVAAAKANLPVGSGLGTFVEVYRQFESQDTVTGIFVNHAHNDLAELVLELGVPGVVLLMLLLLWWARQTLSIWRSPSPNLWLRAATIAAAVPLAHSLVDYPLRTAAISALFAACLALMTDPRTKVEQKATETGARHLSAD